MLAIEKLKVECGGRALFRISMLRWLSTDRRSSRAGGEIGRQRGEVPETISCQSCNAGEGEEGRR